MSVESIFERIPESLVYRVLGWTAVASVVLGCGIGALTGYLRKNMWRYLLYGALIGVSGPILYASWAVLDARTSYFDRLYNAGPTRFLWRLFPPVDYYEHLLVKREISKGNEELLKLARFREVYEKYSNREAVKWWWKLFPPDRLDSAPNILMLVALYIAGGFMMGIVLGYLRGLIDAHFPARNAQGGAKEQQ